MTPEQIKVKLESWKSEAEQALTESSRKEGQLDEIKSTIEKEFEIHTLEEAQDELKESQVQIDSLEKEIQDDFDALVNNFGLDT